jgi:hypothetical protein
MIRVLMIMISLLATLAVVYSTLQPDWLRFAAAAVLAIVAASATFLLRKRRGIVLWLLLMVGFSVWYVSDRPSNDRDWAIDYAVPATVSWHGRTVRIDNIRNFRYHADATPIPAYYNASFSLDDLAGVDLITSYWAGPAIAHVFVSFAFLDGRHLAFSIETRQQKDGEYSTIAGFFHHYELFYVVADERDVIGLRTDIRRERVFLYHVHLSPDALDALFVSYLQKIGDLAEHPEWYNTIADNCTTGILGRARAGALEIAYNWRVLLTGYAAAYAYNLGLLDQRLPFPDLVAASRIVRPMNGEIGDNFSADIRRTLPQ